MTINHKLYTQDSAFLPWLVHVHDLTTTTVSTPQPCWFYILVHIYVVLEMVLALEVTMVSALLGLKLETSRWNIMAMSIRLTVYKPVRDMAAHFVADFPLPGMCMAEVANHWFFLLHGVSLTAEIAFKVVGGSGSCSGWADERELEERTVPGA
ncbi:hypothetical protein GQ457_05G030970 [Hibiscus cannabinus]